MDAGLRSIQGASKAIVAAGLVWFGRTKFRRKFDAYRQFISWCKILEDAPTSNDLKRFQSTRREKHEMHENIDDINSDFFSYIQERIDKEEPLNVNINSNINISKQYTLK